jgi:hypothetical protein
MNCCWGVATVAVQRLFELCDALNAYNVCQNEAIKMLCGLPSCMDQLVYYVGESSP